MRYFISIDIGTNFLKATAFSFSQGHHRDTETSLAMCSPIIVQSAEQDDVQSIPRIVSMALVRSIQKVFASLPLHQDDTIDICISGNSPTLVFLNKKKEAIYCTSWYSSQYIQLENERSYYLPYVMAVKENNRTVFDETHYIVPLAEYASFLLCGTLATFVPHMDFLQYLWSTDSVDTYNFSRDMFPQAALSGSVLGAACSDAIVSPLTPVLSSLFLQKTDIALTSFFLHQCRVLCGGIDYLSALVGSSTVEAGDICIRGGTSTVMNICLEQDAMSENLYKKVPDHSTFPEFVLSHPVQNTINKGISIPSFTTLYQQSNEALEIIQHTSTLQSLFWKLFFVVYKQCDITNSLHMHMRNSTSRDDAKHYIDTVLNFLVSTHTTMLQEYFSSFNASAHRSVIALCYLFYLMKKVYVQLTDTRSDCHVRKIAVSGGQCSAKGFARLLSVLFQKNVIVHTVEYCELVGNVLFALVQDTLNEKSMEAKNGEHSNIASDMLVAYAKQFSQPSATFVP